MRFIMIHVFIDERHYRACLTKEPDAFRNLLGFEGPVRKRGEILSFYLKRSVPTIPSNAKSEQQIQQFSGM